MKLQPIRRTLSLFFGTWLLMGFSALASAATLTEQGSSTATETTSGISSFFETIYNKAPAWIAAMVVFACSFIVAKIVKERVLDKVSAKFSEDDADVLVLIGRITYVAVLGLGVTIALSIAGIDLTAIIAAVGFGVGFAMQDLIMNFFAGVLILLNRQFTIGDFIQVNNTIGKVEEIQSRATILKALDGTRVIVPNADLFKNQVTSFTSNPFRRVEVAVGVEYRTDLAHAHQVILEALQEHEKILHDPPPAIILDSFGDSSINFFVRFWVDSHSGWLQIKSEVIHLIKQHFDKEGIGIPFPIRTLVFDKETEDVVMPVYQVPEKSMESHRAERATQEEQLSAAVEGSRQRTTLFQDVRMMGQGAPQPVVVAATPAGVEVPMADVGQIASMQGAVGDEDIAEVAQAAATVQNSQETSRPPEIPVADLEDGRNFLRANK